MRSILFEIPNTISGWPWPVFGWGMLLLVWVALGAVTLWWQARRIGWGAAAQAQLPLLALFAVAIVVVLPRLLEDHGMSQHFLNADGLGNNDGVVSREEATDDLETQFARIDRNGDGALTQAEVRTFYGRLPIRGFGVMLLAAVGAALLLAIHRARQMRVDPDLMFSLVFWLFIGGIVGARLFYIVQYWDDYRHDTLRETLAALSNVAQGGLVVYGSVLGGGLAMLLFARRHRLPVLPLVDLVAPSLALAQALGRVGCFLNGCCFGGPCDLPWGVTFPTNSPPYVRQLEEGQLPLAGLYLRGRKVDAEPKITSVAPSSAAAQAGFKAGQKIVSIEGIHVVRLQDARDLLQRYGVAGKSLSVQIAGEKQPRVWTVDEGPPRRSRRIHPTQLYSLIDGLVVCLFLLAWWPYRRRDGEVTVWLMVLYAGMRFLVEFIRTDEPGQFGTPLSISQWASVVVWIVAGVIWWIKIHGQPAGSVFDQPVPPGQWRWTAEAG